METVKRLHDMDRPGDFWLGRVVSRIINGQRVYGHIVGLYRTNMGEVGIDVQWEGGERVGLHHNNIDLH